MQDINIHHFKAFFITFSGLLTFGRIMIIEGYAQKEVIRLHGLANLR